MTSTTLILMACSNAKRAADGRLPLLELYDGPMWRTLRANLGAVPEANVCALSGHWGFVNAKTYSASYNKRLSPELAERILAGRNPAGPAVNHARRHAYTEAKGYELVVYERVIIAAPGLAGLYRRTLLELVEQLKAAGLIAPGAEVLATEGGILAQCGQLKRWLGELNAAAEIPAAPELLEAPIAEPAPAAAAELPLEAPIAVEWARVASPLERKRARAAGRVSLRAAPLFSFDQAQGVLF